MNTGNQAPPEDFAALLVKLTPEVQRLMQSLREFVFATIPTANEQVHLG